MPSTDNIVISFDADVQGMQPAVDILEKLGVIDKQTSDQFKKSNSDYQARRKALDDLNISQKSSLSTNQQATKSIADLGLATKSLTQNIANGTLQEFSKEIVDVSTASNQSAQSLVSVATETAKATNANVTYRTQLRAAREELNRMEAAGQEGSDAFDKLAIHAGELEHQMDRTAERIRILASPTFKFDVLLDSVRGLAAGFELIAGSQALFGDKSKELEETLIKVQGAMALVNSLIEIQRLLTTQNAAITAVEAGQKKLAVLATQLDTAAKSENIIVSTLAAGAQKALNLAQEASPGGILVGVMIALAGAFLFFTKTTKDATEQEKKLNDELQLSADLAQHAIDVTNKQTADEIKLLEDKKARAIAEGKSLQEIRDIELEIESARRISAQQNIALAQSETKSLEDQKEIRRRAEVELIDLLQKESLQHDDATQKDIENTKNQIKALTTLIDLQEGSEKQLLELARQSSQSKIDFDKKTNDARLQAAKLFADSAIIESNKLSDAELKARVDSIKAQQEIDLQGVKDSNVADNLKAAQSKLINAKANDEIRKAQAEFLQQRLEDAKRADEAQLALTVKDSKAELDDKIKIIEDSAKVELAAFGKTENEKKLIQATTTKQISELRKTFVEKEVNDSINIEKADADRRLAISKVGSDEELQAKKDLVVAQEELDTESVRNSTLSDIQKAEATKAILAKSIRDQQDLTNAAAQKELQLQKDTADAEVALENSKLKNKLTDPNLSPEERQDINAQILANQEKLVDNEQALNEAQHSLGLISEQEYQKNILLIQQHRYDAQTAMAQAAADIEKQFQKQVTDSLINTASSTANTLIEIDRDNRQTNLDESIASIESERDVLLSNKKLTEDQKEKINKDAHDKEARLKLSAWQAEQDAAAEQAAINGLVAITKTFAEYGFTAAAAIAVAALIAETGLQVAAIESKSPPRFEKGTDYVTLNGNKKGIDTVPALLTEGEGVDTVDVNRDYSPALKKIRRRKIKPSLINKIVDEIPSDITETFVNSYTKTKRTNSTNELKKLLSDVGISKSTEFVRHNILNDDTVLQQMQAHASYDVLVNREMQMLKMVRREENISRSFTMNTPVFEMPTISTSVFNMPSMRRLNEQEISEITNVSNQAKEIDYEKLTDMLAKKMSDQMAEHVDDIAWRNRQDLQRGIPVSNLGQVVKAINESNTSDPYRR